MFLSFLNRSAVISGNENLTEAAVRKPVSSHFVCFAFRLLPFHLLRFRLLSQQTKAKVHCNYIRLETSSVCEIILLFNNNPNQILSDHAVLTEWSNLKLLLVFCCPKKVVNITYFGITQRASVQSADAYHHYVQNNLKKWSFGNKASTFWKTEHFCLSLFMRDTEYATARTSLALGRATLGFHFIV